MQQFTFENERFGLTPLSCTVSVSQQLAGWCANGCSSDFVYSDFKGRTSKVTVASIKKPLLRPNISLTSMKCSYTHTAATDVQQQQSYSSYSQIGATLSDMLRLRPFTNYIMLTCTPRVGS